MGFEINQQNDRGSRKAWSLDLKKSLEVCLLGQAGASTGKLRRKSSRGWLRQFLHAFWGMAPDGEWNATGGVVEIQITGVYTAQATSALSLGHFR